MKYIFFLILVLQHCYLNPVFRGTLFSEQDEENLDILALAGGLGGSGNGINELEVEKAFYWKISSAMNFWFHPMAH